jgi:hypothetical protein
MLSDHDREETERLIERIIADAIPDPVEDWGMLGPHQIGVKTTTDRYFVIHVTPIPGVMILEEFNPSFINSHLN